jgi:phosphate acetyltransferase
VDKGLFETARVVAGVNAGILPGSAAKIAHAADLFARHVDANVVASQLALPKKKKLTPGMFKHTISEICKADPQHIVLPEGTDRRVLAAAAEVTRRGLARVTLLGAPAAVAAAAARFNSDISACAVLDSQSPALLERYAGPLAEARAAKGVTREQALDLLADPNMLGTMMVRQGDADGMVSGATCTTAATIRPALQVLKTPRRSLVSSVFFMCLPDRVLVYGDCAVVVDPSAEELAQIAATSADTAAAFGIEPRVAMLSYSTGGSGAGPAVDKVAAAAALVQQRRPELAVEGPIQVRAARRRRRGPPALRQLQHCSCPCSAPPAPPRALSSSLVCINRHAVLPCIAHAPFWTPLLPPLLLPVQYDAAVDPVVAAQKIKGESLVAGRASVLIFPDLNTGNNVYKAVQQSTGAVAIGPLIQGLVKPVNDLSRGCTVIDIVNTVACTAVQAIGAKRAAGAGALAAAAAAAAA